MIADKLVKLLIITDLFSIKKTVISIRRRYIGSFLVQKDIFLTKSCLYLFNTIPVIMGTNKNTIFCISSLKKGRLKLSKSPIEK